MGECAESSVGAQSTLRGPMILAKVITDALETKKQGVVSDYGAVIEHLSASQMKADGMKRWLHALRLCVSHLTREHEQLVAVTLRFSWYNQSADLVDLYIDYLSGLLSAQTCYLRSVLQGLVSQLCQPHPEVGGDLAFYNIHRAINVILELVPTAPSLLATLLSKHFPFKGKGPEIQELALRNVLHVTSYCPTLRDDILELVVHQMLLIDVEVPSHSSDEVLGEESLGEEGQGDEDMQFHVEMESALDGDAPVISGILTAVHSQQSVMSNDMAEKLDIMMSVCFEYLHSLCHSNGMIALESAISLFKSLLKIFDSVLLPTHACSHVQFLIFKVTTYHKSFPNHFLEFLWERFSSPSTPTVLRQTCAAYMASYIARANFVTLETAKLSLSVMVQWIHQYIDCCSVELMRPELKHHAVFFSLCQAVFYIFVFRHKSLTDMPGGISFIRQLNMERIVSSRLNPLKICLPSIVEMFAELTARYELLFCYTILEQNKRLVLSTSSSSVGLVGGASVSAAQAANPLDCFFPFDPYTLKRSSRHLQGLYTEWEEEGGEDIEQVSDLPSPLSSLHGSSYYGSSHPPVTHSLDSNISLSLSPS